MSAHTCPATVYDPTGWGRGHECGRKAVYEHEGKHYCKTHHPPTVQAKRDAKHAEWQRRWNADHAAAKAKQEALAEQARRAGLYDELLAVAKHAQEWTDPESVLGIRLAEVIAKATGSTA